MSQKFLTVVIPAFKPDFLDAALQSLLDQSVQDFDVLVVDDFSPFAIENIARKFEKRLNLRYHRFSNNLGSRSLAAQWSRSVRLTDTPWVWLFSDDDLIDPQCIETLLSALNTHSAQTTRLFRFNTRIIDQTGKLLRQTRQYPPKLSGAAFVQGRMDMRYSSFACEYIFSREAFDEIGGFVEFPAGWCSDDASWVSLAGRSSIVTLSGPMVCWRRSDKNISSPTSVHSSSKADAMISYIEWLNAQKITAKAGSGARWFLTLLKEQRLVLGLKRLTLTVNAINKFDGSARLPFSIALIRNDIAGMIHIIKEKLNKYRLPAHL